MICSHFQRLTWLGILLFSATAIRTDPGNAADARGAFASQAAPSETQMLSDSGETLLRGFLSSAQMPDLLRPNFANYQDEVKEFYDDFRGSLPWMNGDKPTAQARAIILSLKNAADKGLSPEDYESLRWDERLAQFGRPAPVPESDLVKFDLALTVATMRYISDLHIGRVNPHLFHFGLDINHQQKDLSEFLRQKLVNAADVDAALETVEPPFPIYRRTQGALKKYMEFSRRDGGEPLPAPSRAVGPGDFYAGVPRLASLLLLLEDFPSEWRQSRWAGRYQGALVEAVRHFQGRHGLEPNGIIDTPTLRALNVPLSRRIIQLQLAMERMRWLPHEFERPPIVVNIPEFRLYAVNEEYRSALTMKVVVGRAYGHQTPVFANEIKSVIFRPYWNVPPSIARAELLPHLEKNPSYFSENSYEIVDRDEKVVREGTVGKEIEAELRAGNLRVRQTPGPQNALGLVKFEFPNEFDVYMHDTPSTQLFSRSRRDFSHGCIRVEDPVALAKWVLQGMPEWTEDTIRAAINGEETMEVKLKEPIPVLILYSTAVVMEDEIRFFDDVYGLDVALEQALAQRNSNATGARFPKRQ